MKRIFKLASILGLGGLVAGCNSFLDKEPDNRASIDNLDKVSALLVSAYPSRTNMSLLDPRCDYIVDMGATLDGSQPSSSFDFVVSGFMWDEYTRTESSNDTYEQYWTSVYEAISAANHALAAIETLPTSEQANAGKQRAEALMTRAYNHFTLLTMYANMFDSKFADVNTNMNPGVPYVTEPEDVVIKYYDRGTVAGTLEKIKNDFNQAIRDIGGSADYAQPKYHFTLDAANAFGARMALYTGDYGAVIAYANALGLPTASKLNEMTEDGEPVKNDDGTPVLYVAEDDAANMYCLNNMNDWNTIAATGSADGMRMGFSGTSAPGNLLISECVTVIVRGTAGTAYARHGVNRATMIEMLYGSPTGVYLNQPAFSYSGDDTFIIPKFYEDFKMDNVQAQTGLPYAKIPLLRREEVLLARAEAFALTGRYQDALNDLNIWTALRADATEYVYGKHVLYKDLLLSHYSADLANEDHFINSRYNASKFTATGDELRFQKALILAILDARKLEFLREGIRHCLRGDVFQIVLSRRFEQPFKGDDFKVYRALRSINPSPYLFYFDFGGFRIFGSSPETHCKVADGHASIDPIAGTAFRTGDVALDRQRTEALLADPKENAEHVMLVDLARNDLSRNAHDVQVDFNKEVQYYSHVIHLVSRVSGEIDADSNPIKTYIDTFPAGTLSGAPKVRAMQLITDIEKHNRGAYGGCIGFIGFDGDLNQAITIRTFVSRGNVLYYQAGAGIVAKSNDERELQEVNNKLGALKKAIDLATTLIN